MAAHSKGEQGELDRPLVTCSTAFVRRGVPTRRWLAAAVKGISPDGRVFIAIAAAVVLANLAYVVGLVEPNPLGPNSGLASVKPGVLAGVPTLDDNAGIVSQALGHRAVLDLLHLQLPWWNPYEGTGAPLAGEMQSAAFFPPTALLLIPNGQLYEHMLLELIAGCSTYLLLRRLALRRIACAAGGIAFALNGTFAWFTHAPVNPVAFLPLLLLGIEIAHTAALAGRRGGWWLIAVSGALSLYAGFPEVAYIDTLLAIIWAVWRAGGLRGGQLRAFAAKSVAGAIVAMLLSAPLLIAFVDYLNHAYLQAHASSQLGGIRLLHLSLAQLLLPYVYGPPAAGQLGFVQLYVWGFAGGYLWTSLLLLGVLGLFSSGRRGLRLGLLVWILLTMSRMYGEPPGLAGVLGIVPGMSHVLFFRYAFPSLELAVIVLAAIGLHELGKAHPGRRRLFASVLTAFVLLALAAYQTGQERVHTYFPTAVAWGAIVMLAVSGLALMRRVRARTRLIAALVALEAVALFAFPELSAPRSARVDLAPVAFLHRHLGEARFFTMGPLAPNYGSYFGLSSLNAMDVPVPSLYAQYVHKLDPGVDGTAFTGAAFNPFRSRSLPSPQQELVINLARYRAAGVSYVLTLPGAELPQSPAAFQRVFESSSTWVYHLAGARRFFSAPSGGCRISSPDLGSAQVSCPTQTSLIRLETDLPGWSAAVDGRPVAIRKANGIFQVITVSAGSHRVTFDYAPPNVGWGFAALVAGCAWLLIAGRSGGRTWRRWLGIRHPRAEPTNGSSSADGRLSGDDVDAVTH
jgi:hypothetical protein